MLVPNPYPPPASDDGSSDHSPDHNDTEYWWFSLTKDEIIDTLRKFYDYLIRLYISDTALKLPPPEGWPNLTAEAVAAYGKSDFIVDLMRHLPYIENDEDQYSHRRSIEYKCYVQDYSTFTETNFANEELGEVVAGLDDDETAKEHWLVLAWGYESYGKYILLNAERNEIIEEQCEADRSYQGDFHEYWEQRRSEYENLKIVPIPGHEPGTSDGSTEITEEPSLDQEEDFPSQLDVEWIRAIYINCGWPGTSYDKDAALKAIDHYARRRGAEYDED